MDITTIIPIGLLLFALTGLAYAWREIRDLRYELKQRDREITNLNDCHAKVVSEIRTENEQKTLELAKVKDELAKAQMTHEPKFPKPSIDPTILRPEQM